ncbi:ubiquinol-cytochrome c reductase cytochrome c subunit [Quadrisphaera granulorum]|uniref:Cytochrome bc1 complex cytochrome c subunit n=1 Tax=Quadrisphaera granulorum TaxID=317664 RepID=A0A316AIV0_9ACTN|nr:c-type cytochrome [Quadrisphaera granulorum]PWJ49877.1 ubiquinol-cytochrome c reductase cytochrome c subunit [Quadrisphaera granulorum]SZE98085.1 ubiquinol-cytochrome c reductase cytochrome c subunit [Quadrisphaera granulorum]
MKALAARRRHPLGGVVVMLLALLVVGGAYSVLTPAPASAAAATDDDIQAGKELFLANCANCHGLQAQGTDAGPTLIGVGSASVDFQVGTGRMPLSANQPQAHDKPVQFSDEQIAQMGAFVASLGPGPAVPPAEFQEFTDDPERISKGNELFRTNCAMCHNVVGAGGALTRGKWAPNLQDVSAKHIYEAMLTGPQSMPVFNDANITPEEKQDIASYLHFAGTEPSPGGLTLGGLGPVSEGLFAWAAGILALVGCAVWLGAKAS